jgi:UDP-N-acetylmuramoyl-L-alanyl-D-glutamate--2,6-diaminopimelate ligase
LGAIAAGLSKLEFVPGRLEAVQCGQDFKVLVDYAHTDDALKNVLTTLRPLCRGRLTVVFGCGGDRDRSKRPRMARVTAELADSVIVTSDNPRTEQPADIIEDITKGFSNRVGQRPTLPTTAWAKGRRHSTSPSSFDGGYEETGYGGTKGPPYPNKATIEPDRKTAIQLAIESARKGDIVLIAGKGHETYQIIGAERIDFDDRQIARELLKAMV